MRQTCYLIMPDRFANGNQKTIAMLLQRKIQSRFTRRKTRRRHSRDNKNLDYISSLGATAIWSTPLCEDNDKATPITPMLNLMFIKLTPLRNKCWLRLASEMHKRHEISYGLCCQSLGNRTLDDERFNTGLDSSIWKLYANEHKRSTINDSNASK
jgi:hypothetical protein